MAFSAEKTLEKIRKYGSKSYISEDRASAEERLAHQQDYYYDHEDEAKAKYQAYLQQAKAEQEARDAQKRAVQDYNYAAQYANRNGQVNMIPAGQSYAEAQYNQLLNARNPVNAIEGKYRNPEGNSVVEQLARKAPYTNAEIRSPYKIEDEDPQAKAEELSHYENVMSGKDANQKTLSRYETNRYIGLKKNDLPKDVQKALSDYKQGHDLIQSGINTNVSNEIDASALPSIYWDNSGSGQSNIETGRKLEDDARKKLKASGMSDEDIVSWLGKDDDDYKNSMLGFQDDYALEEEQSRDNDRETNDRSAYGKWKRLYGTAMTSMGSPLINTAKGINTLTTRPAKQGLNTSRGFGTVTQDFDQFRQNASNYYRNRYGKTGEFLYNAATSTMDSAVNAATFGTLAGGLSDKLTTALGATGKVKRAIDFGNAILGSAGFSASSYADAYQDALDRGLDEESARKTAVFNGAMEGITEAVSLDNVWDIAKTSGSKAARSALVDFLMQSGIEGSEEGAGDIADRIYDDLANGGMSEFNQNVRSYMQNGLSEKDAKAKANSDWWKQTGLDILAGSISGAVMGGGTHVLYSKASAEQAKSATENFGPEDFGTLAANIENASDEFSSGGAKKYLGDAAKTARDISSAMKNGNTPSDSLYTKLQESIDAAESIEEEEREEARAKESKNAANTPVEEDYHYRFQLGKPTLSPEEQQRQKAMQSMIQSGIDNANASDKYKIETTHLGDREGYQEMYNAANSSSTAEDKLSTLGRVYNDMKHSTDAGARANAESYYQLFTAQLGVSDEQARQAKTTTQDAYLAGKSGDTNFTALNAEQKAAYNEGAQDYLKSRSASSVSDAENLRHAEVVSDSGTAKIDSIADIRSDKGERSVSVKLDNGKTVSLTDVRFSDRSAGVLYDYMSRLGTKEEMQSFLDNYSPDQQAGRYANAFSEMYRSGALDTAQGKADFEKAYKALPESYKVMFGEDQLRSIYNSGANETSEQYIQDMENQRKTVARKGTGKLYIRDEGHNLQEIANDDNSKVYMPLLRAYAAATKTDIIVADDLDDNINGMYDSAMQRIVLNANNESALYNTVFHEGVGEVLQAYNAKGAQKVRSVLLQYIADTKGKEYVRNIAQKYQNSYTPVEATKSYSDAVGEAMNDAVAGIFSTKEGIHDFEQWMEKKEGAKKAQTVLEKLADHFKDVAESMRNLLNSGKLSKPAEDVATMAEKRASKIRKMILDELDVAIENAQNAKVDENAKSTEAYSIKAGMTDEQRYNELKDQEIVFSEYDHSSLENSKVDLETLQRNAIKECKPALRELAKQLGISERTYFAPDIEFELGYSNNNVKESVKKQNAIPIEGKYVEFAKMLTVADEIIENSHLIEVHDDAKYQRLHTDHKTNKNLKYTYELVSGFMDNDAIIPVKLTVKQYQENTNAENGVYVMMTLPSIKKDDLYRVGSWLGQTQARRTQRSSYIYKLADILTKIKNNPYAGTIRDFIPDQFANTTKSLSENIPTKAKLSIDVDQPVQQTKDLIAVHNLDEEKLLADIKELGGFPAPSIAIIRQGMEHNGYGDISVLFEKDTIDPERSKYNHVYGGDAWTPTFPTVEYDINDDVFYKAREKFKALKGRIPFYLYEEALRVNNNDTGNVQYSGMDSFVQKMEQNYGIRAAYVASKGIQIDDNAKRTEVGKYDDSEVKAFEAERNTLSHIGVTGEELREMPFNQVKQKYGNLILQAYQDRANTMDKKKAERFMEKAKSHYDGPVFVFRNMVDSIANALDYYKNGNPTHTEYERDEDAIRKQIDENIKEKDLESWIRDTYEGLVADKGISNGADPYTPSGNRRSFRATHYALTLDNVVRAMREQQAEKGANALTETGFTAVSTKDFKNIDDIHANEDSIQSLSEEEYKSLRKNIDDKVDEIANRIKNTRSEYDLSYLTVIADAARARHTAKGIESYLRNAGMKVYEGVGQEILDLKQEASMLPARYFEAKPMRAVGLDEIADVIAPDTVSDELKKALESNNIPYELYKAGDNADRTQKMNAHENLRFSINIDDDFDSIIDQYAEEGSHEDVLKEGEEALGSVHVSASDTYRLAQKLVSDYGLTGQTRTLSADLQKVFAYMEKNHGNLNTGVVNGVIDDLARPYIDNITETVGSEEYDDIMSSLGEYEVRLTDKQLAEVKNAFGSLARFKSVVKGSIRINQKATTNLDQAWSSICDSVPGQLDVNTAEGDEPLAIADLIDAAQPVQQSVFDGETADEMAQDMSLSILKSYYDYATKNAVNDKVKQKAAKASDRLKTKQTEMRAKMRERYNERLIKARKDLQKHFNDRITVTKNKDSERLAKTKAGLKEKYEGRIADIKEKDAEKLDATKKAMRDQQVIRLGELKAADLEKMAKLKARNRQKWQAAAESRRVEQERKQIDKHWSNLFNMLDEPTDNKHIPKALQGVVMDLLDSIDQDHPYIKITADGKYRLRILDHIDANGKYVYQTKDFDTRENAVMAYRAAVKMGMGSKSNRDWQMKMSRLDDLYRAAESGTENDDALNDFVRNLDPDIAQDFHAIVSKPDAVSTALLNSDELHTINKVLCNVETAINQQNKSYTMSESVREVAEKTMADSRKVYGRQQHHKPVEAAQDFVELDNATPETYFHMIHADALFKSLWDGYTRKSGDLREAQEYMIGSGAQEEGTYKEGALKGVKLKDIQKWTGNSAEIITIDGIRDRSGKTLQMTPGQIMSLYELSKRKQAMMHITGGIKVDSFRGENGVPVIQDRAFLTIEDINMICNKYLTGEQRNVADSMQRFMAENASRWGNEASNLMFGYDKFTEKDYFPISVDKNVVATKNNDVAQGLMNAIKNLGFTKSVVPNASNPLMVQDIFDVYTKHVADMATYHSYAAPITDMTRFLNYKVMMNDGQFNDYDTVKDAITRFAGKKGVDYATRLLGDLNGMETSTYINPFNWAIGNYKAAAVGWNIRVVLQQPTSIMRAADIISPKYLMEGQVLNKDAMEMQERTSMTTWAKKQGNVDGYIYKSMKNTLTGYATPMERLRSMSMDLAGKADDFTWKRIYNAAYLEQRDVFRKEGKEASGKEFEKAVNDRFDEIIVRTQVTDATILRSQIMRSQDTLNRIQSAFMAEPTKSYNMLLRAAIDAKQQSDGKYIPAKIAKGIRKEVGIFLINAMTVALAKSMADWFRKKKEDDEDAAQFLFRVYKDNFLDEINPFQLMPIVKDVSSSITKLVKSVLYDEPYYNDTRMDLAVLDTGVNAIEKAVKLSQGKGTVYGTVYAGIQVFSQLSGVPVSNLLRDFTAVRNKINDSYSMYEFLGDDWLTSKRSEKQTLQNAYKYNQLGDVAKEMIDEKVQDSISENQSDIDDGNTTIEDVEEKARKSAAGAVLSKFKEEYQQANDEDRKTMKEKLVKAMEEAGVDKKTAEEKIDAWVDEKLQKDLNGYKVYDPVTKMKVSGGDVFKAINEGGDYKGEIAKAVNAGKEYKDIEKDITARFKDEYLEGYKKDRGSVTKLKNRLEVVYSYLDQKEGQKKSGKREWLENPEKYLKKQAEE